MGDYANFNPPNYVTPDPPAPIEDNLDELAARRDGFLIARL